MSKKSDSNNANRMNGVLINQELLLLMQAILHVDKKYLAYADTNANADDKPGQIIQLERVFAYELYHQWSLLKDNHLILNGEVDKLYNNATWYPDMVLHGGQDDPDNNKIVVEIKRECMVNGKPDAILDDLEKLSKFLEAVDKNDQCKKYRNYDIAVFILLKGDLKEIENALKKTKALEKELNGNVICMTYNEKGEIRISSLADLKDAVS